MGTDIHLYVERREAEHWQSADNWTQDKYDEAGTLSVSYEDSAYHEQNYDCFAILANVQNGEGFAGCDTGDAFEPIRMPRGLPGDLSPELAAYVSSGAVEHTPSWLLLSEILEYDWTRINRHRGYLSAKQFSYWDRMRKYGHLPPGWSGDISGPSIRKISNDEMRAALEAADKPAGRCGPFLDSASRALDSLYTQVEFEMSYAEAASDFWSGLIPKLLHLAPFSNYSRVRIVFWFDS